MSSDDLFKRSNLLPPKSLAPKTEDIDDGWGDDDPFGEGDLGFLSEPPTARADDIFDRETAIPELPPERVAVESTDPRQAAGLDHTALESLEDRLTPPDFGAALEVELDDARGSFERRASQSKEEALTMPPMALEVGVGRQRPVDPTPVAAGAPSLEPARRPQSSLPGLPSEPPPIGSDLDPMDAGAKMRGEQPQRLDPRAAPTNAPGRRQPALPSEPPGTVGRQHAVAPGALSVGSLPIHGGGERRSRSSQDMGLHFDAEEGSALELVDRHDHSQHEPAMPSPAPEASQPVSAAERGGTSKDMQDRYAVGDFTGALVIAESILDADPNDAEAGRYAQSCREVLTQMYAARLGPLDQVVTIGVAPDQIRWLSLDHRAGFLLSLVDGISTIEEILDISGMTRLDALRIMYTLAQQKVVTLS